MKFAVAVTLLIPAILLAQPNDDPYTFCSIAGFLQADSSEFPSGVALTAANERGVFMNAVCNAAYQNGQNVHRKLTTGQQLSPNDQIVMNQSLEFKKKVFKYVLRGIG